MADKLNQPAIEVDEDQVIISDDRMTAYVKIGSFTRDVDGHVKEVLMLLMAEGVTQPVDEAAIRQAMVDRSQGARTNEPIPVAHGKPPQTGADGYLEWLIEQPKPGTSGPYVDSGVAVVRVVDPKGGTRGEDVLGRAVGNPQPGRHASFIPGKNLQLWPENQAWHAETDGVIRLDGARVSVRRARVMESDIQPQYEGYDLQGCIHVKCNILDGVDINVEEDLYVGGNIGNAKVVCGGNLGVIGRSGNSGGKIIAGGSIRARELVGIKVRTRCDLYADLIKDCTLSVAGNVICPGGTISGGIVQCSSLDAGELTGGAVIVCGPDFPCSPELERIDRRIEHFMSAQVKLQAEIERVNSAADGTDLECMEAAEQGRVMLPQIDAHLGILRRMRDRVFLKQLKRSRPAVTIRTRAQAGVEFRAENTSWKLSADIEGPIEI